MPRAGAGGADPYADGARGRKAHHPLQIPGAGWKDVLLRIKQEIKTDNLSLIAAGVAFYFMLSLFPVLIATVSVYGLVADPVAVEEQIARLLALMPREAGTIVADQLRDIVAAGGAGLGLSLLLSVAVALWSASKGAKALLVGLNIAYEEAEDRGAVRQQLVALAFTAGFVVFAAVSLGLIAVLPHVAERLPLGLGTTGTFVLTWGLLFALLLVGLAIVYRYGPARNHARWQWVSLGSLAAAALWLLASLGFSWYAARFGSFNETYGTLAGGVMLLLWLQITAFATLLGAEINAEIEHQTAVDSTVGEPKPMGQRNATMADTLGAALGAARDEEEAAGDGDRQQNGRSSRRGGGRRGGTGDGRTRRDRPS